jgi:hypothetical protein
LTHRAFNGDIGLSPFKFEPFHLRSIAVHAGGYIYPQAPYSLNFTDGNCVRAFVDMYEALGAANSDRSPDISLQKWRTGGWTFLLSR